MPRPPRDLARGDLGGGAGAERRRRAREAPRGAAAGENLEEQKRLLESARERLTETFKSLSADVLRASNSEFLTLAQEAIGRRQDAIDAVIRPLSETLARYDQEIQALEAKRERAYGSLLQQVETLSRSSTDLQKETSNLVTALRAPQVRGRWGELTLHRVVELAGMVERCDYVEQQTVEGEAGRLRPDMVVNLPSGRRIIVDAKVPLTAYLEAVAATTDEERRQALGRHAQQVRQHMNALAGKAYWSEFAKAAEFVVMFIPGESFVAAAAQADAALLEDGLVKKVVVATPSTLIALLRVIEYGWRQEEVAENAEKIRRLGQDLYDRMRVLIEHVIDVGDKLGKAAGAYNKAVGSIEARVLPAARRFSDLGAGHGEEIALLKPIDEQPRAVDAAEVPRQLTTSEVIPEATP
jgi:DNA recombination protein RmuC